MNKREIIDSYLTRNEFKYEWSDENSLAFIFEGKNGCMRCGLQIDKEFFVFFSGYIHSIPKAKILKVIKFINKENCKILFGNFVVEEDEVYYKTYVDTSGRDNVSDEELVNFIYINIEIMDLHLPNIDKITGRNSKDIPFQYDAFEVDTMWKNKMEDLE